jgi:hypothetical protein
MSEDFALSGGKAGIDSACIRGLDGVQLRRHESIVTWISFGACLLFTSSPAAALRP